MEFSGDIEWPSTVAPGKGLREFIGGTVRNCGEGHFTVGGYVVEGTRVVVIGVYGTSCASDVAATRVLRQMSTEIDEVMQLVGTRHLVMGGDFNIKLDAVRSKPRAQRVLREIMTRYGLVDAGKEAGWEATWRRPNHLGKSRIDYVLYSSEVFVKGSFSVF